MDWLKNNWRRLQNMGLIEGRLSFEVFMELAVWHTKSENKQLIVKIPMEISFAFRAKEGDKVYFAVYEVKPMVPIREYFSSPLACNPVYGHCYQYAERAIHQLSYFPVDQSSALTFVSAVEKVATALRDLGVKKIVLKGGEGEAVLLSKLFHLVGWEEHPPIHPMYHLAAPAPGTLSMQAMEAGVQALVPPHQVAHQGRFLMVDDDGN